MKIIGYLIALLAVLLPHPASAQTAGTSTATAPATIEGSERHTLAASRNRITYQIDIVRVESALVPTPADYRLPVIYVLDGNGLFPLAAQAASSMVAFGRMPGALVVGIGYPVDPAATRTQSLQNRLAWRTRDLTPAVPGQPGDVPGAAQFLMFIEQDLKPFIASRYAVDPSEQTLAGHSLGGLFAAWTLMNAPDSFSRYVLSSPSLFWNNDALIKQAA